MTAAQAATLVSAALGFSGTSFLFFGSYGFEPPAGSPFNSPQVQEWDARVKAKNAVRKIRQRTGLVLLIFSFAVQATAVFLP
jgi:hypothetical protein